MKRTLYLLTVSSFMTSCATIMNSPHDKITIYTTEPARIIYKQDTIKTTDNKAYLMVERKNEVLKISTSISGLNKSIEVKPRNSFMFWSNIFCNSGIGILVDWKNPKRYAYPQRIYINSDTLGQYAQFWRSNNKGELGLHLSLPHINSFYLTPEHEGTKANTGFWGLSIGLDYYHSPKQFVSISVSGMSDFFVPFPAPVDISGEYELMSSGFISLANNHKIKRLSFGYGFSYARNTWDLRFYNRFDPPPPTRAPVKKSNTSFGLVFPAYFQVGEYFNLGFLYRPTFYRPGASVKFSYEHLISIEFAWKLRLKG